MAEQIVDGVVQAAGGVVWRQVDGAAPGAAHVEVLLVHRPRYYDWTFPKGKLEPGETMRDGAVRELQEETGYDVQLGDEVAVVAYIDHLGREKEVHYFAAQVLGGEFVANDEVDHQEWVALPAAGPQLSYRRDAEVAVAFGSWLAT